MLSQYRVIVSAVGLIVAASTAPAAATVTYVAFDYQDIPIQQFQGPFTLPAGGEVVEARVSVDIDWLPVANPATMVMSIGVILLGPGGEFESAQLDFFALEHFAFDGAKMTGTLTTTALNGTLATDEQGQAFGSFAIFDFGGFGFFGTGDLRAEFDVVPEPATVGLLLLGAAIGLRRRL